MRQFSDPELMELVRAGDFDAFDEIYRRYSERIRRFLFNLSSDEEAAQDQLQEVFLQLYRYRHAYRCSGTFSTYLFAIARNCYLSWARRRRRGLREVSLGAESAAGVRLFEHLPANERMQPEVRLLNEYRRLCIRRAIASLPDRLKLVFVMSHLHDMSYAEISEVLGVPVGTVKSRMFQAVRALRALLKEDDNELQPGRSRDDSLPEGRAE